MNIRSGQSQIRMGFFLVCLVFTIPILFLFYYMIQFKNSYILLTENELVGIQRMEQLVDGLEKIPDLKIVEKVRQIAIENKVILDEDLDTYYISEIVVTHSPQLYAYGLEYTDPKLSEARKTQLQILGGNEYEAMISEVKFALAADKDYYGENAELQSQKFKDSMTDMAKSFQSITHESPSQMFENARSNHRAFWRANLQVLRSLYEQRIVYVAQERNRAIAVTLGFWLLSLLLVFFFARRILKKQEDLYREIESQNLRINFSSKLSAIGEMSAGIAHEINTPLAAIRLNSEMLIEAAKTETLGQEDGLILSQNILEIVDHISRIIISMRKISRDASGDPLVRENLAAILQDSLVLCGSNVKKFGIKLNIEVPEDIWIQCRAVDISQVLINLINNAVDACGHATEKVISIRARVDKDKACITIQDSGPAVPLDVRQKFFEPYFTTKPSGKGTGLGLGIVQRILNSHQATITLLPDPHTCLQIEIPLSPIDIRQKEPKDEPKAV